MISTPLVRGETSADGGRPRKADISIHSPHARGDHLRLPEVPAQRRFQSAPLMRGETAANGWAHLRIVISIRSPLTRGDVVLVAKGATIDLFQSTPLMRGETAAPAAEHEEEQFQSTPLMRGETMISADGGFFLKFQSTPLMRGETMGGKGILAVFVISILSPHARGDRPERRKARCAKHFNPLPSCEGRLPSAS